MPSKEEEWEVLNDEQAAGYEKLQDDLAQIYSVEFRRRELQMAECK